jgi:MFS family permease
MQTFLVIWIGQFISITGSGMTRFALLIWAYDQTREATTLALLGFSAFIFAVLLSPIAGVWVDRLDRRVVMLLADGGAGISTALVLLLYTSGSLEIWHLFIYEAITGALEAFQMPAYSAATTMLVEKRLRGRVNGLRSLASSAARVFAPMLGAWVLSAGGIAVVMVVDLATFIAAYGSLLWVRIPRPERLPSEAHAANWRAELAAGLRYLLERPGLRSLVLVFAGFNAVASLTYFGVFPALILARTNGDESALAFVRAAMGAAAVAGGFAAAAWGGRFKLIHGVLAGAAVSFLFGDLLMGMSVTLAGWLVAAVVTEFFVPIIVVSARTIMQNKVPAAMQGRVFALEEMLRTAAIPLGYLLAGPLADRVFEPAMMPGGALEPIFGGIVGTGAGAGMGVMYLGTALMGTLIALGGYLIPALRHVERDTPDADEPQIARAQQGASDAAS